MTTVILSGGSGTRMWPISRTLMPKQFVRLNNGKSLFQKTVERNKNISSKIMVISNEAQKFLVLDHLSTLGTIDSTFIWEEEGKNSAAAIIMAALNSEEDEILNIVPSDHLIEKQETYEATMNQAKALAQENNIVAVGIEATFPATGYGYISHKGEDIKAFIEKPEESLAKSFLEEGGYLWNGGMYCFKVSHFIHECERVIPEFLEEVRSAFVKAKRIDNECSISAQSVKNIASISIDTLLMEKITSDFKVVKLSSKWNDLGSFDALDDLCEDETFANKKDENLISINANNNCVISSNRMIATLDVDDLIIVDTPDALLITKKGSSQGVKEVVAELKRRKSDLVSTPSTVVRPWGNYTVLENNEAYKTKKIVVKPGKRLSLQSHFHRNEHWIIVSGTARVTVGEEVKLLCANESTYIPAGYKHRLENPGIIDLVMIEAQVGEYLEEDDIVRYEDDFNRAA